MAGSFVTDDELKPLLVDQIEAFERQDRTLTTTSLTRVNPGERP
jgi:hypothetical protein